MTGQLWFSGKARIQITGANPEECLYRMVRAGIPFRDYRKTDPLTAHLVISASALKQAEGIAEKNLCNLATEEIYGIVPFLRSMGWRICYPVILCLILVGVFLMQNYIWFLEVEGNTMIPSERILRLLEGQGIGTGASIKDLDMNQLKNRLLTQEPQLRYITINTQGGMATVIVREREEKPENTRPVQPADIVAKKGGIITQVTPTGGTPVVQPGDVVTEGQLLISGVTRLDKTLILTRAEGEVYARTFYHSTLVTPVSCMEKNYTGRECKRFSVSFGKKTINFYKSSGISYDNYDRMTCRTALTLPGGYRLPVTLIVTTCREYQPVPVAVSEPDAETLLYASLEEQLKLKMTAGEILSHSMTISTDDRGIVLSGNTFCREEIGSAAEIKD